MKLDVLHRLWAEFRTVWREITADEQPTEVCEKPCRSTDPTTKVATQLKWMLMKIYRPQVAFDLRVTMQRPKSRMGYYTPLCRHIVAHTTLGALHRNTQLESNLWAVDFQQHPFQLCGNLCGRVS